ncbi:MAG: hypothetical protein ACYS8X_01910 [Planctomycetota bacterium]|jgi:hypothetical protein
MASVPQGSPLETSAIRAIEDQLAATLTETADEIEHSECFDSEERSEVYTILKAMLSDSTEHRDLLTRLAARQRKEVIDV